MGIANKGGEAVAQSMANAFGSFLNAEVDAISAAWGDGVPLPHVASSNIYVMLRKLIPTESVAIVITPFSGKQLTNHATDWGEVLYRMEVDVICWSDDQYTVQVQLDRYLTAVWQVCMKNPQFDGSVNYIIGNDPVQFARSAVYKSEHNPSLLEAFGAWQIDVDVEQRTA